MGTGTAAFGRRLSRSQTVDRDEGRESCRFFIAFFTDTFINKMRLSLLVCVLLAALKHARHSSDRVCVRQAPVARRYEFKSAFHCMYKHVFTSCRCPRGTRYRNTASHLGGSRPRHRAPRMPGWAAGQASGSHELSWGAARRHPRESLSNERTNERASAVRE